MNVTQKPKLHQDWIDPHAIGIVRALQRHGYTTYLVGGCVRDLLLGIQPKDFDIATTARPEEVRKLIHRSYIIGKRFQLVLVRREDTQFEVATFRRDLREDEDTEQLGIVGDNLFGTAEEDARRRDFTINGLFYDPIADQLIDFPDGRVDLEQGWVRMIGDPRRRLLEDPIRILRALRLKHMICFSLDPDLRQAIQETAGELPKTVLPRRREEILKLLRLPHPHLAFREAEDLGVLAYLSPHLDAKLKSDEEAHEVFDLHLAQLGEKRIGKEVTPGELFGFLVHAYVRAFVFPDPEGGSKLREALDQPEFQSWMRDELGMFKFEQSLVTKAFHTEMLLTRRKDFQRRGERRQTALLASDAFPLALRFAEMDGLLCSEDLYYWKTRFEEVKESGITAAKKPKRRRSRRKKKTSAAAKANP